jgi:hypothetical protein
MRSEHECVAICCKFGTKNKFVGRVFIGFLCGIWAACLFDCANQINTKYILLCKDKKGNEETDTDKKRVAGKSKDDVSIETIGCSEGRLIGR